MPQLRAAVLASAVALLLAAPNAHASFHLMKVVEVFGGTAAAPNAHYVVIQMYSGGQSFVGGHHITVYNAAGTLTNTFTFSSSVANGSSQDKILIATPEAASFFGLSADLTMSAALVKAGGKVCFDAIPEDCVAWGAWTGGSGGVGTPFNAGGGLIPGKAAIRRLDIATGVGTSNSQLDAADDTDDSANDFLAGLPAPKNNARASGTVPANTCGNLVVEGLEQCDDGDATDAGFCVADCSALKPDPIYLDGFE